METNTLTAGWRNLGAALKDPKVLAAARIEANGPARWASWKPGVEREHEPLPRATANLVIDTDRIAENANSEATFARYAPGTPRLAANLQVNVPAFIESYREAPEAADVVELPVREKPARVPEKRPGLLKRVAVFLFGRMAA